MGISAVRIVAVSSLKAFASEHPDAASALEYWARLVRQGDWSTQAELQASFPKAKVLGDERVRFEVRGGYYRLIAAFDFRRKIVFIKFLGTHAEYDRIDPFTVSKF